MQVKLISVTKPSINDDSDKYQYMSAEELIVYTARVSSPSNQENTNTYGKLIKYLIENKHWSPFEMADMCVEIKTSRAIAQQILRHRSFSFQEFSQRYAEVTEFEPVEIRKQGTKNRQGGEEVFNPELEDLNGIKLSSNFAVKNHISRSKELYDFLIKAGVSKESARMVLPLTTQTTIYMKGSVRSWIHYLQQRLDAHAQKEHRLVAEQILDLFYQQFPVIALEVFPLTELSV